MQYRKLEDLIDREAGELPVQAITGPRQSGKTTLARKKFPDHTYLLLEEPDVRHQALSDPRGFFRRHAGNLILDEVQKAPDLLSYVMGIVDEPGNQRHFVLTGSEHLLLSEKVAQTLAGRLLGELCTRRPLSQ